MPRAKYKIQRRCTVCGKDFFALRLDAHLCGNVCQRKYFKRKKKEELRQKKLDEIAASVPDVRDLISVTEATSIFSVCRDTLYRLIREGKLKAVNLNQRLTRLFRSELETKFMRRTEALANANKKIPKLYSLEPEDCFSVGEITKRFGISEKQVYEIIRKNSIPIRQIGKYVLVPKIEIFNIIKGKKH